MEDSRFATDLVMRLRDAGDALLEEAAEELLRLQTEVLRLRRANHDLANKLNVFHLQAHLRALQHA